ncbi:unnamed protein product [Allacma fusca]|uniref:Uncharacterized protein n=1 Tax=Allacma fusca TaxID=39272 RepID=A0A8J2P6L0_9HEXA|nr:unnamed protein product [Allacma fusca]
MLFAFIDLLDEITVTLNEALDTAFETLTGLNTSMFRLFMLTVHFRFVHQQLPFRREQAHDHVSSLLNNLARLSASTATTTSSAVVHYQLSQRDHRLLQLFLPATALSVLYVAA